MSAYETRMLRQELNDLHTLLLMAPQDWPRWVEFMTPDRARQYAKAMAGVAAGLFDYADSVDV